MSKYKIASKKTSDLLFPNVRPTLDLNFVENQKVPPFVNVTRNSQTTYVDKFGILRTADINQPVFEWDPITGKCLGARIWGVVTNQIRNNTMVGAAAGTPGTVPTNWNAVSQLGLSRQIAAVGVTAGIDYVDIRYSGTTTSAGSIVTQPDTTTVAAQGQTWTASTWLAIIGGSTSGITFTSQRIAGRTSAGSLVEFTDTSLTLTSTLVRYSASRTMAGATIGRVTNDIVFAFNSGAVIDITLRIGLPQLEQSATMGPVVKTTTTAASSTADAWSITGVDAAKIINTAEGTLYVDFATGSAIPANQYPSPIQLQGTDRQNEVQIYAATGLVAYLIRTGSVVQAETNLSATTQNGVKSAFRYAENNSTSYVNGSPLFLDTVCTMPTTDRIFIGNNNGSENFLNGYIRRLTIYPKRLTDTQLRTLTR